jgi:hypothetical protein
VAVVAAVMLAALAGLWWWRRRRARFAAEMVPVELRLPPEVVALRALDELERDALTSRGQIKEHYARLSLILRTYMERRFRFPAVESTTYEIGNTLEASRVLDPAMRGDVLALLDDADLVKFARFRPAERAPADALVRARGWVEATRALASAPAPGSAGVVDPAAGDGVASGGANGTRSAQPAAVADAGGSPGEASRVRDGES